MDLYDFGIPKLPSYIKELDARLKSIIPEHINGLDRLLRASGKRLRPYLVIAIAYHSGKQIDHRVITAATAVELVHIASLIHDDILDNGTKRWGVPTLNSTEGVNSAILAGDYLLAKGCSLAASISLEAGVLMSETIAQLCVGQALESNSQFNLNRSIESLNDAIVGKTSSMFIASCVLGGIVSGLESIQIEALTNFAKYFGIAFQYIDDIIDFTNDLAKTGKTAASDVQSGNYTFPILYALKSNDENAIVKLLKASNVSQEKVVQILNKTGAISKTHIEINRYINKAVSYLDMLENIALKNMLLAFVQTII